MKLTVLGKYGPFPPAGGATSGYLLEADDKKIVLDCGSGVFSRLSGKVAPETVDGIIISHFHADHAADVPVFAYYLQQLEKGGSFDKKIKMFCPKSDNALCAYVSSFKYFDIEYVDEGEYSFRGMKLRFYKTLHPELCYGVNVSVGDKSFSYTGDTNLCPAVDKLYNGADLVLADGGFLERDRNENSPHMSVENCIEYSKKQGNKSIISHICPLYEREEILKIAGSDERWEIAEEGKSYGF